MKIFKYKKTSIIILLIILLGSYNHCTGNFSNKPSTLNFKENTKIEKVIIEDHSNPIIKAVESVDAFATTLHPILINRCGSCHGKDQGPLHSSNDKQTAHDAIINGNKVNFENIENSRLVLKVKTGHNCWSDCDQNANEILEQIEEWKNLWKDTKTNTTPQQTQETTNDTVDSAKTTAESGPLLNVFQSTSGIFLSGNTVILKAESSSQKAPATIDNSGDLSFVSSPSNGNFFDLSAGSFSFSSSLIEENDYKIYAKVYAPNSSNDSLFLKINSNPVITWNISSPKEEWQWQKITDTRETQKDYLHGMYYGLTLGPFQGTILSLTRSVCISCHGNGNPSVPQHASNNPVLAIETYKNSNLINFENIEQSKIVQKVKNGHRCWSDCQQNALQIQSLLTQFRQAIQGVPSSVPGPPSEVLVPLKPEETIFEFRAKEPNIKLAGIILSPTDIESPEEIFNSRNNAISFDLSSLLNGTPATLTINVEELDEYTYKFTKPRIISNVPLKVKNMKLLINRKYNLQHATYTYIDQIVEPGSPRISNSALIAFKDLGPTDDKISFSFEILEVSE